MSMWLAEVDGETCAALRRLVGDSDELYEKVRTLFNASWFRSLVKDAYEKRNSSVSWRHAIEKGPRLLAFVLGGLDPPGGKDP